VPNTVTRRTAGLVTSLVACPLMLACGGDGKTEDVKVTPDSSTVATSPDSSTVAMSPDSITIVFQLTGLMLAVPPKQVGDPMNVVLPTTHGVNQHYARLGFGGGPSPVCVKYHSAEQICYVDLTQWSLDPVGGHLGPQDLRNPAFPRGVVNVSRGAGGGHTVSIPGNAEVLTHVDFLAGHPREDACRLARWRYTPAGPPPHDTISLVNRMYWDIPHPRNQPFQLTFRPKSPNTGAPQTVSLMTSDSVYVVLAHVPEEDTIALPPGVATPAPANTQARLDHFRDFYKLLRRPGTHEQYPPDQGPLPDSGKPIEPRMCAVRISTPVSPLAPLGRAGIKTYGCVVGSGEG
jgi:hypothetical protein